MTAAFSADPERKYRAAVSALEKQRNGEWRYLEFLQVTSWITAGIFMREIPGGTRARHRSRPVDLPEHRYRPRRSGRAGTFRSVVPRGPAWPPGRRRLPARTRCAAR